MVAGPAEFPSLLGLVMALIIRVYAACKNFVQMRSCSIQYAYDRRDFSPTRLGAKPLKTKTPRRSMDWSVANTANMSDQTGLEASSLSAPSRSDHGTRRELHQ